MPSIRRVQIERFRGIERAEILLGQHNIILGRNNSGKTALIEALALALGRDRVIPALDDYDFFNGFYGVKDPLSQRFQIRVLITGFEGNRCEQHPNWFNAKNGTGPLWWSEETRELVRDPPEDAVGRTCFLAAELGCCGYYSEEECEYRVLRHYVDGPGDPLLRDSAVPIPAAILRELGVYLLPSRRIWDRALTFAGSTFTKTLKEQDAIPDEVVQELRRALAGIVPPPEGQDPEKPSEFGRLVAAVQGHLERLGLLDAGRESLRYRPTELDLRGILTSLSPHLDRGETWLPLSAQGQGVAALQNLFLLLELAKRRRERSESVILLVEEPELHVHPGLQQQVALAVRATACQTVLTTHSPYVAAAYWPGETLVLRSEDGVMTGTTALPERHPADRKHLIKSYFFSQRLDFLGALLGRRVLVPEGDSDADWLNQLRCMAEAAEQALDRAPTESPGILTFLRTKDARVRETVEELVRLGCWVGSLSDGDEDGRRYATEAIAAGAALAIRWGSGREIEDVVAWLCAPNLTDLGVLLGGMLSTANDLASFLKGRKKDPMLRTQLLEACTGSKVVVGRVSVLMEDLSSLCNGGKPNRLAWSQEDKTWTCDLA